jgi:hypothetical protein
MRQMSRLPREGAYNMRIQAHVCADFALQQKDTNPAKFVTVL